MSTALPRAEEAAAVVISARNERAYRRGGGFSPLPIGEDVASLERLKAAGYCIHRDTYLPVTASARTRARAPFGFAHHRRQLGRSAAGDCA